MTPEQRIAQLEADLARERARADGLQEIVYNLTAKRQRSSGADRQAAYRARQKPSGVTGDVTVTRNGDASLVTSRSLPPPLEGSPPLPDPISPSPISSPPSFSGPANPGLHERLSEVHMRHRGNVLPWDQRVGNAQHLALTKLAVAGGKSGGAAEDEVVRRFDYMLQRQELQFEPGRHKGTTLTELLRPECWGANAKPPLREQPKPAAQEWLPPGAPTAEDRRRSHQEYLAREAAKEAAAKKAAGGGA